MKVCRSCTIYAADSEQECPKCGATMSSDSGGTDPSAATSPKGSVSGFGVAAVVLGGASLFVPYLAAVFFSFLSHFFVPFSP